MTGADGTAGLDQIAQPPHAHCSVDLNKGGQKPEEKPQMDGVQEGNNDRRRTWCKQAERRCQMPLSRKSKAARCKITKNGDVHVKR